jgi:hypothetical protein
MVLHGLKDATKDVYVGCTSALFNKLAKKRIVTTAPMGGRMICLTPEVDMFEEIGFHGTVERVEGLPVESLETLLKWKLERGREKDLADAEIIKKFLELRNKPFSFVV